ncbi:MAG TPA: hypothetical protein VEB21_07375 [Terriglobales bacterium]|nr:hypothetical protein [Terriglobales bacterium]
MMRLGWLAGVLLLQLVGAVEAQRVGDTNCDGGVDGSDMDAFVATMFAGPSSLCPVTDVNRDDSSGAADLLAVVRSMRAESLQGPEVTFFGLSAASGSLIPALGTIGKTPVYFRNAGSGFRIVVEAGLGTNSVPPGDVTVASDGLKPAVRPDLQVVCTRDLGDGSETMCAGGVPAIAPPHYDASQRTSNAINDLGCHFHAFTSAAFGCTNNQFGNPSFVSPRTRLQFCLLVVRELEFPLDDTLCSVQVRDRGGNLGPPAQFILRVGSGPMPPTFTPTQPPTATPTQPPPTATRTHTPTRAAATPTSTATVVRSTTPAPTRSATVSPPLTPQSTATRTPTRTLTRTFTRTISGTPTRTPTPGATATASRSHTPAPGQGPVITFFGLARPDDLLIQPVGTTPQGVPIYQPGAPFGMRLVIEARPGLTGATPGAVTFSGDPLFPPDLQLLSSQPLGNGSSEVCDKDPKGFPGGVPAVDPPIFSEDEATLAAISDLSCRFVDGSGAQLGRFSADDSCVATVGGIFRFVHMSSTIQFCSLVDRFFCFPSGDTTLTARVRDQSLVTGPPAQIIIRNLQTAIACPQ